MTWVRATRIFIVLAIATMFIFDLFAVKLGGFEATISNQIYSLSSHAPILSFLLGIPFGHFLWPLKMKCQKCKDNPNEETYGKGKNV
jgi:hypothetical protein